MIAFATTTLLVAHHCSPDPADFHHSDTSRQGPGAGSHTTPTSKLPGKCFCCVFFPICFASENRTHTNSTSPKSCLRPESLVSTSKRRYDDYKSPPPPRPGQPLPCPVYSLHHSLPPSPCSSNSKWTQPGLCALCTVALNSYTFLPRCIPASQHAPLAYGIALCLSGLLLSFRMT